MKIVLVLAMHGAPPRDFPPADAGEFFSLHVRMERRGGSASEQPNMKARYAELDQQMREWPRTQENDPYHAASLSLGLHLHEATGMPVVVGFNEFCAPDLYQALDQAVAQAPDRVVVVTPMLTRGGEHAEIDIPAAIERALARHAGVQITYVWPYEFADIAEFLAAQIRNHLE